VDPPTASTATFEVGKHVLRIENGIVQMSFSGRVSMNEAIGILDSLFDAGDRFGMLAALVDLDGVGDVDARIRRLFARPKRPYPVYAVAYYGGTFASRVLMQTVVRAGRFIAPKSFPFDMDFLETEAEARRFLETARKRRG
jgi:hypothetical protein